MKFKTTYPHSNAVYLSPECRERELVPQGICTLSEVHGQASGDDDTTGAWWEEDSNTLDW